MNQEKILIIDDEFPMRYLIEHQLRRQGYSVNLAKDGPTGIESARHYQPDLILLDVMMPGMDGYRVCAEIRNNPQTQHIPVIFLTASATRENKSRAYDVGADDYMTKPFRTDELLTHITAVLRRAKRLSNRTPQAGQGNVAALFSPKGGVGTTTLAVQLGEAITMQEDKPSFLIDLDLPLGGVAPMLNLYTQHHVAKLLQQPPEEITLPLIQQAAQRHRADLLVLPAPGELLLPDYEQMVQNLPFLLQTLTSNGYQVILDLGSKITAVSQKALQIADIVFVITSGKAVANKLHNAFMDQAPQLGITEQRLLPVVNELYGPIENRSVQLNRTPVAHIPHTHEPSRTRLWLREQGVRKLVSVMM